LPTSQRGKRSCFGQNARRPLCAGQRFEALEPREVLSSQAPVVLDATPYNAAFVNAAYQDALGRPADSAALNGAVQQLNAGQARDWLPAVVVDSNEYASHLVTAAYQQYLGRTVDSASLNFWIDELHAGLRDEDLAAALVGSDEFYARAGGNDAAWIGAAYQALLGRPVDAGGLQWATNQLTSGVSRSALALELADSTEREDQVVRNDYLHYWGATPDDASVSYWAAQLGAGQTTDESLVMQLMDANQYYQQKTGVPPTVVPEPVPTSLWQSENANIDAHAAKDNSQVVFLGDSITAYWQNAGATVWAQNYAGLNALNAGVGGDRTENVLWRIEHGNLGENSPKVVVLMIGINNLAFGDSPQDVATGVASIVATLRDMLPDTMILVLGILPALETSPDSSFRQEITATNQLIQQLADGQNVFYLDMGPAFTRADGTINAALFQQYLVHPNAAGYEVWAQTMNPYLQAIMAGSSSQAASQRNLL